MIEQIYGFSEGELPPDHYGAKINAAARAYGFGYDFCRFYRSEGGLLMMYNSGCTAAGCIDDIDELSDFLSFCGAASLECPPLPQAPRGFGSFERKRLSFPKATYIGDNADLLINGNLKRIYEIISASFNEKPQFDLWYADTSHRIRHGVSTVFLYKNAAAARLDFAENGIGYISDTAVAPERRRQGLGSELLKLIGGELAGQGLQGELFAYKEMLPFYLNNGFRTEGGDVYYRKDT